jgi:TPR repeat protein
MKKRSTPISHPDFLKGSRLEEAGDIQGAIRAYRRAARDGDVSSQSNLGSLLDDKVKPPRRDEAIYWYKRAARRGHWVAASNLAIHYRNLGQPRWQMHWLKVAASLGDPDAKVEIGKLQRQLERARAGD